LELTEDQFVLCSDAMMKIESVRMRASGLSGFGAVPCRTRELDTSRDFGKLKVADPNLVIEDH